MSFGMGAPAQALLKSQSMTLGMYFLKGAPAFMRGEERFSAPGKVAP